MLDPTPSETLPSHPLLTTKASDDEHGDDAIDGSEIDLLPRKLSSKNIFLPILSPAISIILRIFNFTLSFDSYLVEKL
ncbi:hypothetical protein H5410_039957 [Solanum commersonii]|uniref:Uncharacterized protein n=1 Tax=Solanum commersonii TaxID=4109 RepID=A0A9J5XMG8_SOLCO|nr:hypothetical protein H5410_039957 [Solanum commersonii]